MKRHPMCILVFLVTAFLLMGCSRNVTLFKQARKQYNLGDFKTAFYTAAQSVQLKSTYVKAHPLIEAAYKRAVAALEDDIVLLNNSTEANRFDYLVEDYEALIDLQTTAKKLPTLANPKTGKTIVFATKDYGLFWNQAFHNAADFHYQKGVGLAASGTDKDTQKHAAMEFRSAFSYVDGYRDAAARYKQSRLLAIKRIAILPFEDKSGTRGRYGALSDILVDGIISRILDDPETSEFLEIISREQMHRAFSELDLWEDGLIDENTAIRVGSKLGADEMVTGKITQIDVMPPHTAKSLEHATSTVKIGEEDRPGDDGKSYPHDVMGEVHCEYMVFTRTCSANITGSLRIIDLASGQLKKQDTFTAENPWAGTWARIIHGDGRALSTEARELCDRPEQFPPTETNLVTGALQQLTAVFVNHLKDYVE
jgi:hypothetical protein